MVIVLYFLTKHLQATLSPPTLLMLAAIAAFSVAYPQQSLFQPHFLYAIVFMLLGLSLSRWSPAWMVNPVTTYIGKVSSSMYLVHFAVLQWLIQRGIADLIPVTSSLTSLANYGLQFLITLGISVAVSKVFYRWIEVPTQKVGANLVEKWEPQAFDMKREPAI